MNTVPYVARWWGNRSDPQRLHLYTRWSFYFAIGLTPLLAVLGLKSNAGADGPVLLGLVAGGAGAVAVLGALLARTGLGAEPRSRRLPPRLLALSWVTALVTATAWVLAFRDGSADAEGVAVAVNIAWPLGTVLVACSTVWGTWRLVQVGAGIGALIGVAELVSGGPPFEALLPAVMFAATLIALAVAFRFSVWVLDLVSEMERTRGVQVQLAVAEERLRFSRDLHDVMGRNLSAIAVKSQLAGELVRRGLPDAAKEVEGIGRLAEESLREVRDVVRAHRNTDLAGELAGARSVLRSAGVACTVQGEAAGPTLPGEAQTAFGWVAREAVTNVLRHSQATSCTITLRTADGTAELQVRNDGVPDEVHVPDGRPGTGLTGLAERLSAAGGSLETRLDGSSFVLTATLPGGAAR